jgi:septum formation protein
MEKYKARDIADALAELKATKVSSMNPANLVIGCDQILELEGSILKKPASKEKAIDQILTMSGKKHVAYSGAVICENGKPVWRFVGKAELYSNYYKEDYVTKYVNRNWESIKESVGGYKIEEEGSRLFSKITGDFFSILGMPLIEINNYLSTKGSIDE